MMSKKWRMSRTFWFNLVTGIVGVTTMFSASDFMADKPELISIMFAITAVGNLVLRKLTKVPIA